MTEKEDFLSRWSRRKRTAEHPDPEAGEQPAAESSTPQTPAEAAPDKEEPEFDLSTLPSLDSITSATDVSVFLQKGIPLDLARAALRRAWSADPAIRDFVGIAENAWDFNDPNAMHGFGPLDQSPEQVRQMLARVMGEVRRIAEPDAPADVMPPERVSALNPELPASGGTSPAPVEPFPEDEGPPSSLSDGASQHADAHTESAEPVLRRIHGGALPK